MDQIPSSNSDSRPSPMNINRALQRMGGDRSILCDLANFFLEDKDPLLKGLSDALDNANVKDSARHAHSLSGTAANFAADSCSSTAKAIEEACLRSDFETARSLMPGLQLEVSRLVEALQREGLIK